MNELSAVDGANKRRRAVRGMGLSGILMGISIVGSAAYSMIGMNGAFDALGGSDIANPDALGQHVGRVLVSATVGAFLFLLGLVAFVICWVNYLQLRKTDRSRVCTPESGAA
jgi:F0F1-type ATP synthase membrane subunit c/vacuolar-type H+-ATPase subunit K